MPTITMSVNALEPAQWPEGRVNFARLDATTENDIARHHAEDIQAAHSEAAKYARSVRKRLGLTQQEFSRHIHVPLDTVRNWEQGKRQPTGPAKALLKIIAKNPEMALATLAV